MKYSARRAGQLMAAALTVTVVTGGTGPTASASQRPAPAVHTASSQDWPSYLNRATHTSFNGADRRITPANVSRLVQKWNFVGDPATMPGQPGPGFIASPTVTGGAVFIGSQTGWFYKLSEWTGAVLSKVFLGYQPKLTCAGGGIAATATVATDPSDGQQTVYVAGVDGYLYALSAADLSQKWRSVIALPSPDANDYFQWSSPTVVNGKIYVGVASNCDQPLVPGALISYDQATGTQIARFDTMPDGIVGGTIWSSAAVDGSGNVYVTTGNAQNDVHVPYYSESIIKLDPVALTPRGSFTVPAAEAVFDGDFGASPTIFGRYVGACDKNGVFYALFRSTMKLAWSTTLGQAAGAGLEQCNAAAVYDGKYLYVSGPPTTIGGTTYPGSIQRLDPTTGAPLWQTGLPNCVLGTPTMNGGGVIAVGTYDLTETPNAIYLISAATGQILRTLAQGSPDFAQNVFANGWLFTADDSGVSAWGLPSAVARGRAPAVHFTATNRYRFRLKK